MLRRTAAGLLLLTLSSGRLSADIVTLKTGQEIEGLVVDVNPEHVTLRRAVGGIFQSWRLSRGEVTDIRLASPDVAGFRTLAQRLESERSPEETVEAWRRVCTLRPEGAADQIRLLRLLRRTGRLDEAAAAGRTAARVHPRDQRLALEQGEVALAMGRNSEAVDFAREHLRLAGPASEEGAWLLGRGLEACTLAGDAMETYRGLLRERPRRSDALERFVDLALSLGRADDALREAERVTRAAPDLRAGWIATGKIRYREGRFPEAVTAFQSATRLGGPDYDRARIFLQCALARRYDRVPLAVLMATDLETAFQLDPELRREQP